MAAGLNKPNPPYETADKFKGGVHIISPEGKLLDFIPIPVDEVTNCAFGGPDLEDSLHHGWRYALEHSCECPRLDTPSDALRKPGCHSCVSLGPVVHREGLASR